MRSVNEENRESNTEGGYVFDYVYSVEAHSTFEKGTTNCLSCGIVFKYEGDRRPTYCPECVAKKKRQREIKEQNKRYRETGRWSKNPSKIKESLQEARARGLSYGQYQAMKANGWLK